jgi:hypothetical protein|tara:strand:- start:609 stop:1025 length:417 start_codon:yes stop_codon:yes gene_type:complete
LKNESIDNLVDIWIDHALEADVGWPTESMLSKFILYRGTFQDATKPGGLEKYLDKQNKTHEKLGDIQVALSELDNSKALAIIAKRYFRGLNDKNKTYTNKDRASEIGQRLRQFENNVSVAYKKLSKTLEILEKRQNVI